MDESKADPQKAALDAKMLGDQLDKVYAQKAQQIPYEVGTPAYREEYDKLHEAFLPLRKDVDRITY